MINYNNILYQDYLDLMYSIVRSDNDINPRLFPRSDIYFTRYHLQEKFNKRFTLKQVKELLAEELALGNLTLLDTKALKENASSC